MRCSSGFCFGTLAFHIVDLPQCLAYTSCHLFAYYVQLYRGCSLVDIVESIGLINRDLDAVHLWSMVNKFKLNALKSNAILIYDRDLSYNNLPSLKLGGECIGYVSQVTNLGVTFNKTLTWDAHVCFYCSNLWYLA